MTDVRFATIAAARQALERRELSATELVLQHLDAIERINPLLNAYVAVHAERALTAAADADRALARRDDRPLLGIPVSVKDILDEAGIVTTAGSVLLPSIPAEADAPCVARLREAGAIVLGRANLHEFAFGGTTENPHFGSTRNPWDLSRIAGGSSGGSAAAVAAGLGFASIGTDTGGSVRGPASVCGVCGLKPTFGRVSRRGVFPLAWTADHVGPLARTVADCATILSVIAGSTPDDDSTPWTPDAPRAAPDVRGVRIGQVIMADADFAQPDVVDAVVEAMNVFRSLGAVVTPLALPQVADAVAANSILIRAEAATIHADRLARHPDRIGADVLTRLRAGQLTPADAYVNALRMRQRLIGELSEVLARFDVIALPTRPITAPRIGESDLPVTLGGPSARSLSMTYNSLCNVTGMPALSLPCGFDRDGLPIGLQLIGRWWDEATIIAVGDTYQQATSWHGRVPAGLSPFEADEAEPHRQR